MSHYDSIGVRTTIVAPFSGPPDALNLNIQRLDDYHCSTLNQKCLPSSPLIHRFLALGMKSAQFFINHCATFDEPQEQKLPITTGQFDKLDVFFNSVTHLDTTLQKLDKIFMSIFLYQCLKESGYFDNVQIDGKILYL